MNFLLRQKKLREHLATTRFDALLINHLPNIRYLCGFTGSAGFLLLEESGSVFFTDVRYDTQGREEVKGAKVVIAKKAVLSAVAEWIGSRGRRSKGWSIGIESEHMTVAEKRRLTDLLPRGRRLQDASAVVERARMVKDADELKRIRAAVQLGANLFDHALKVLRPGVKETDVAAELEYAARQAGAEEMSFPTIIASGARSALPHGRASEQLIAGGGFVVCDFGVILGGYCSDQTRTVWAMAASGVAPKEARVAYESVREAQQAAIAAVRPGIHVAEVDEAARKVLRKAGLGRYFTHSTGHGVGLEIHEPPRIAAGQEEILRPGMVITIEPGVYFPGKWGVRIEDMLAVSETGCEVLTPTSKDFLVV
ncbi:MAG TPA: Xaa-Pro peptidase family protein [Candidatus Deferrimicrobiaceae bacterium]|jgi:Xaa-Pro aminopeptidase|nr:Xaa-Pro peptidase family protein [Candidatus Deferrimicrobiaceae bacterium]